MTSYRYQKHEMQTHYDFGEILDTGSGADKEEANELRYEQGYEVEINELVREALEEKEIHDYIFS